MVFFRSFLPRLQTLRHPPFRASPCYSDFTRMKRKVAPLQERKMVDRIKLWVKGGEGGNGCVSFRRSRHDRRGQADGGNGGKGGNVILECSASVWDLSNLQHHLNAKRGGNGLSKNKIGSRGTDKVIICKHLLVTMHHLFHQLTSTLWLSLLTVAQVPVGTVIHLVRGQCPLIVETIPDRDLQPWEIPDDAEVDNCSSDKKTGTTIERVTRHERITISPPRYDANENSSKVNDKLLLRADQEVGAQGKECSSYSDQSDTEAESMMSQYELSEEEAEEETEEEIMCHSAAELIRPGQRLIVAQGGEGGLGNVSLGKVVKNHKHDKKDDDKRDFDDLDDETTHTAGKPGSEAILILELKSIADIGLVGIPNAGKSTLLGAISRAKPEIGHYAFTTLRPNMGNLNYDDFFSATVADIPGLIKGAHENRGLGHAFLRHIERTKILAYVVDLSASLDGRKGIPPWEQLRDLVMELECHQPGLSDRPSLVVANKIDEAGAIEVYGELKKRVQGVPIYPVCAVLEEGFAELKVGLRLLLDGVQTSRVKLDSIVD
ncbi:putative GTP-binding protein [Nymphaea thermarum]|nr:putative GTP-binding protein [Nymphaea thermarum]